jgi:calcineurin-like phosphoesterase family protein
MRKESDKMIWFTSDTHFGHKNIIKYCNRPFENTVVMDSVLIERWNKVVKPNDIVYHLGDFAFAKKERIAEIVRKLNGTIYLVKGNHDKESNEYYRNCGFKEVYDQPIILNEFLILSHYPMPFAISPIMINIFGHVHDTKMYETFGEKHVCVCVERHAYAPISMEELETIYGEKEPME